MIQRARAFTRLEYERMAELGILRPDERVELLRGEIVSMSRQRGRRSKVIALLARALERALGPGFWVRAQFPLALSDSSEPEPDLAIVPGSPDDYDDVVQPSSALLVVEVSETTLADDRGVKAEIYVEAGIAEYWIVNLVEGVVEVRRSPIPTERRFGDVTRVDKAGRISPLVAPAAHVVVGDFLR